MGAGPSHSEVSEKRAPKASFFFWSVAAGWTSSLLIHLSEAPELTRDRRAAKTIEMLLAQKTL